MRISKEEWYAIETWNARRIKAEEEGEDITALELDNIAIQQMWGEWYVSLYDVDGFINGPTLRIDPMGMYIGKSRVWLEVIE